MFSGPPKEHEKTISPFCNLEHNNQLTSLYTHIDQVKGTDDDFILLTFSTTDSQQHKTRRSKKASFMLLLIKL